MNENGNSNERQTFILKESDEKISSILNITIYILLKLAKNQINISKCFKCLVCEIKNKPCCTLFNTDGMKPSA